MDMTKEEFRAILCLFMTSDPWPVTNKNGEVDMKYHKVMENYLDGISRQHGYAGWVEAYHALVNPQ